MEKTFVQAFIESFRKEDSENITKFLDNSEWYSLDFELLILDSKCSSNIPKNLIKYFSSGRVVCDKIVTWEKCYLTFALDFIAKQQLESFPKLFIQFNIT